MSEFFRNYESQPDPYEVLHLGKEILTHFDMEVDPIAEPGKFIEALQQIDPRFKDGRDLVRWELEKDPTEWPEETVQIISRTAEAMQMKVPETPLKGHFDAVIVLGGARQSNLDRTRYAVECAKEKAVTTTFNHLIVAGSSRNIKKEEQEATSNYAPGAQTEFDLCIGAAKIVAQENPGLVVSVMLIQDERAGTPAVIDGVLAQLEKSEVLKFEDTSVAAITTQIYQESTCMDLRRIAKKYGVNNTFVAGTPSDPHAVEARTPATYLTEIIRTLRAATLAIQEAA